MADTLTKEQFPNICRCCLVPRDKKNPQFPLFLQHGLYGRYARNTNASLLEIISGCLGITIDPNDGLPMNICASCEKTLTEFHKFRSHCIKSADKLIAMQQFIQQKESKAPVTVRRFSNRSDSLDDFNDFELIEELEFVPVSDVDKDAADQTWASNDATTAHATENKSYSLRESSNRKFSRSLCGQSESDSDTEYTPKQTTKATKRKPISAESEEDNADTKTKPDEPAKSKRRIESNQSKSIIRRLDKQQRKMDALLETLSANQAQNMDLTIQFNPDIVLPSLPMATVEEVDDVDNQLNTNAEFLDQMVLHIQRTGLLGAGSSKKRVKMIFEKLMTLELAVLYSWSRSIIKSTDSKPPKMLFSTKIGFTVLFKRCLSYNNVLPVDDNELKCAMQDFFKRANYRLQLLIEKP